MAVFLNLAFFIFVLSLLIYIANDWQEFRKRPFLRRVANASGALLALLLLAAFYFVVVLWITGQDWPDTVGTFGDMFGALTSLTAIAAVVFAIYEIRQAQQSWILSTKTSFYSALVNETSGLQDQLGKLDELIAIQHCAAVAQKPGSPNERAIKLVEGMLRGGRKEYLKQLNSGKVIELEKASEQQMRLLKSLTEQSVRFGDVIEKLRVRRFSLLSKLEQLADD